MFRRHIAPLVVALAIVAGARSSGAQTAVIVHRASTFNNISAEALRRVFLTDDASMGLVGGRYDFAATGTVKLEARRRQLATLGKTRELVAQVAIGF